MVRINILYEKPRHGDRGAHSQIIVYLSYGMQIYHIQTHIPVCHACVGHNHLTSRSDLTLNKGERPWWFTKGKVELFYLTLPKAH